MGPKVHNTKCFKPHSSREACWNVQNLGGKNKKWYLAHANCRFVRSDHLLNHLDPLSLYVTVHQITTHLRC